MKKYIFTTFLALISFVAARSQDTDSFKLVKDETTGDSYYEEVIQIPGMSQADLYKKAKLWIQSNMKTADNNINFDEKENAIINGAAVRVDSRHVIGLNIDDGTIDFKFHVWAKDGRCKFRIDNLIYQILVVKGNLRTTSLSYSELSDNKRDRYLKSQTTEKLYPVVSAFKKSMLSNPKQDKKDW